jgi:flagellar hook-basal body complex protein FliE
MQPVQTDVLSAASNAVNAISDLRKQTLVEGTPAYPVTPFSGVFHDAMSNLQGLEQQASSAVEGLVSGQGVDIHQAMIATQKSDLAFEMALAVRGKMVSAYQALMGVQF